MVDDKWMLDDGIFYPISGDVILHTALGKGVWELVKDPNPRSARLGLRKLDDEFTFDFKIYETGGKEAIQRIFDLWNNEEYQNSGKNLGVIFNGIKGTGCRIKNLYNYYKTMKKLNETRLIILYDSGYSCTQIAKILGVSTATISSRLKSLGKQVENFQNKSRIDNETGNKIISLYKCGNISVTGVCKIINANRLDKIPVSSIYKFLHRSNIDVINYQNQTKFDETIFDNIDTEEKAYWLGMIFADGYISSRDNTFELSLKESDYNHLNKFNLFMKYNGNNIKQRVREKYKSYRWLVVNKHLWNTLNNLGCTPRKSLTLKFPIISSDLTQPFMRGYFDGDGCITYSRKGTIFPIIFLLGTKEFLEKVQNILSENNIKSTIRSDKRYKGNTRVLYISNKDESIKFLNYLYSTSTIHLDRKYNRYKFLINSPSSEELLEFLAGENGKDCDVDAVVTEESNKSSEP